MDQPASVFSKPLRSAMFSRWRQLNRAGPLLLQPILPAGLPWTDHSPLTTPHSATVSSCATSCASFVAENPATIGIIAVNQITPGVKLLGITDGVSANVRRPGAAEIRSGHYPLDRYVYFCARLSKGKPMDALALAYLQLALTPEGQAPIAAEHDGYLPLNSTEVAEENSKFE